MSCPRRCLCSRLCVLLIKRDCVMCRQTTLSAQDKLNISRIKEQFCFSPKDPGRESVQQLNAAFARLAHFQYA
ncbi:hypothetical protein KP509_36G009000 [Ceratopteris richardii]|uniref:Uncharacterized protein n=1 Tax=Ceratopteris richardii TaxID=49495 RepID=A0A8T2QAL4_CERRI|nr:hypothetical protein KP509_36G009000 [Ceratopteris richardii]